MIYRDETCIESKQGAQDGVQHDIPYLTRSKEASWKRREDGPVGWKTIQQHLL